MEKDDDVAVTEEAPTEPEIEVPAAEGVEVVEIDPEVVLSSIESLCAQAREAVAVSDDPVETLLMHIHGIGEIVVDTVEAIEGDEMEEESDDPDDEDVADAESGVEVSEDDPEDPEE